MNDLTQFLFNLTSEPGVYRFIDANGIVLYVGKASNLKKRVSSYFTKQNAGSKTRSLVNQIVTIEVSVTRSETEALLLESNLIKSIRPKYNVLLRDDKSYPYIHVDTRFTYPRIEMIRSKKKPKKGLYFGPYPSVVAIRETLNIIYKVFKIRNCSETYFKSRSRPCLQYQIKRCSAPCTAYITPEAYQESINAAVKFLQGKSASIIDELTKKMDQAVLHLHFEEAAVLRDQIKSLRFVQQQQSIDRLRGDADIIAIHAEPGFASLQCVTVRDGTVIANQAFFPVLPPLENEGVEDDLLQQVFEAFVGFYYLDTPERIPAEIVLANAGIDTKAAARMLTDLNKKNCKISSTARGIKSRWVDFARDNLMLSITEKQTSAALVRERYQALNLILGRDEPIKRMECFDISHTSGNNTVASCVVFSSAGPDKKCYRRFNISDITPGDDYAAMNQVISRRFKRLQEANDFPDILIIDGGKTQVQAAKTALQQLNIHDVFLLGIAKGTDRKAGWERLIIEADNREITLAADSKALHLLQHIRDESHRFAITAHRKKRQKAGLSSSLEDIEGIGPKKRHALLQRFGGLRDLANASMEEIAKVEGINKALALRIYEHFRL